MRRVWCISVDHRQHSRLGARRRGYYLGRWIVALSLGLVLSVLGLPGIGATPIPPDGQVVLVFADAPDLLRVESILESLEDQGSDIIELVVESTLPDGSLWTSGVMFSADPSEPGHNVNPARVITEVETNLREIAFEAESAAALPGENRGPEAATLKDIANSLSVITRSDLTNATVLRRVIVDSAPDRLPNGAQIARYKAGDPMPRAMAACSSFWPNWGRISTQPSSVSNHRYVQQFFRWDSSSRLSNLIACDPEPAYEAEAWYSANNGTYLSLDTQAWSTTLPAAYLDYEGSNQGDNLGRTIGVARADELSVGVTYSTYIRTSPGTASTDFGSAKGQAGYNNCVDQRAQWWCVFSISTKDLVPAWNHSVPGFTDWSA